MTRPEDALHEAVANLLRHVIGEPGVCSAEGVLWMSVENRHNGAREGARRKRTGVVAGVPDILIVHQGQLRGIELKAGKGRMSEAQDAFHEALRLAGGRAVVARSLTEISAALAWWGIPHRRVS